MSVEVEICRVERPGHITLGVRVRSSEIVPHLAVNFQWENENHQPCPDGSRIAAGGILLKPVRTATRALGRGEDRVFYLNEQYLDEQVLGRVASLSSEKYWVSVLCGEQEIARVAGAVAGSAIEALNA